MSVLMEYAKISAKLITFNVNGAAKMVSVTPIHALELFVLQDILASTATALIIAKYTIFSVLMDVKLVSAFLRIHAKTKTVLPVMYVEMVSALIFVLLITFNVLMDARKGNATPLQIHAHSFFAHLVMYANTVNVSTYV